MNDNAYSNKSKQTYNQNNYTLLGDIIKNDTQQNAT